MAHNIRRFRKARRLTQAELAEMLGHSSHRKLQHWEDSTVTMIDINDLKRLADIFRVSIDSLLAYEPSYPRSGRRKKPQGENGDGSS